jgi:wobble nucleotide-excising tRNase
MILRIDIKNFGSFSDFVWNTQIKKEDGKIVDFKKLNILYGRNYSGKTTLSRLVRCLETGELPAKYALPEFSLKTDAGTIPQTGIASHSHHIRVFNKDFVDDNLSFLQDDEGKVEPFAVLGGDNTKIEKEIEEKEKSLGSAGEKSGLRYDHAQKHLKWEQKVAELKKATDAKTKSLRNKARELKQSPDVYGDVNYDIRKIEVDLSSVQKKKIPALTQEEEDKLRQLLKQDSLPEIKQSPEPDLKLEGLRKAANALVTKEIKPSKPIQDLLDDALLQTWAKQGIPLHQEKRTTCGFCGNPLPDDLWEKLDQHFSKESKDLDEALTDLLGKVEAEDRRAQSLLSVKKDNFYPDLHSDFEATETKISGLIQSYSKALKAITSALKQRQGDPFKTQSTLEDDKVSQELGDALSEITPLIEKHTKTSESLGTEQNKAKKTIRLSELSAFITTINLTKTEGDIALLSNEANALQADAAAASKLVVEQEKAIEELRKKLRDERRGAEKVNEYLSHYFGHDSLKLVAIEEKEGEEQGIRFEIRRGDNKAYNLSDGECSLIAFCYFMAKLQSAESEGKDLIIYIDDPISSLDSDHIFFAFSLIQGLIAAPIEDDSGNKVDRYKQLFISTHNLDFLKFLKRLSKPKIGGKEHFLLVRTESGSLLELMPFYLQQYVTEFHYLFDQICACTEASKITEGHHCFFSFGNNLRKFLEIYLFFKFPFCEDSQRDYNRRIGRFFDDDPASEPMVMRVTNELSHGGEVFDRSVRPIEHAEISKMAFYVLTKIKIQDPDQYSDLLQATKRTDALEPVTSVSTAS